MLSLFLRFFPLALYMQHIADVASAPVNNYQHIPWNKGMFLRWLGTLIRMALQPLPNVEWHWRWPTTYPVDPWASLRGIIRESVCQQYRAKICIPGEPSPLLEQDDLGSSNTPTYRKVLALMEACCEKWQSAWTPGDVIVPDESMIHWTGTGEVHITKLLRKPTPFGVELKVLACGVAHIVLVMELVEGKFKDAAKKFRD